MTDKQTIIDGVDVSGCCYYADGKCTNSHMIQSNCKNVAVCYYKEYKRLEKLLPDIKGKFYKAMDDLKAKEQECETLASQLDFEVQKKECLEQECVELKDEILHLRKDGNKSCAYCIDLIEKEKQLDQLKAEVKSKTEYIQEQRSVIDEYSKEIEMYKKCQGKRASKREEELKAENIKFTLDTKKLVAQYSAKLDKFKQTLEDIKSLCYQQDFNEDFFACEVLQKISEVE